MPYEVSESIEHGPGHWDVFPDKEHIRDVFPYAEISGTKEQAEEYAAWMNSKLVCVKCGETNEGKLRSIHEENGAFAEWRCTSCLGLRVPEIL